MSTSERSVSTSEATIQTAVIEIKALTLNNKQMTLAVFRQLPEDETEPPLYACSDPKATRWGLVRYEIKDEGKLWLVFSRGGKLYREKVPYGDWEKVKQAQEWVTYHENHIKKYHPPPNDSVHEKLKEAQKKLEGDLIVAKEWDRWRRHLEETLPQLFIAV